MWPPSLNETVDLILILALIVSIGYIVWLRTKPEKSKASFALSLVASMAALSALFVKTITGSETSTAKTLLFDVVNKETGWSLSPEATPAIGGGVTVGLVIMYLFAIYFFYKIGRLTILRWVGPTTLIVNELAKSENENDVRLLALAEFRRLLARRPDPPASEVVVNWRQKISDPPEAQPWHLFVRQIFSAAFSEAEIREAGWRDQWRVWIGQIYVASSSPTDSMPLMVFLFERKPSAQELETRIGEFLASGGTVEGATIYAVY